MPEGLLLELPKYKQSSPSLFVPVVPLPSYDEESGNLLLTWVYDSDKQIRDVGVFMLDAERLHEFFRELCADCSVSFVGKPVAWPSGFQRDRLLKRYGDQHIVRFFYEPENLETFLAVRPDPEGRTPRPYVNRDHLYEARL